MGERVELKYGKNPTHKPSTICWSCERLDCSWMQSLEPVAGWMAVQTFIRMKISGKIVGLPSYVVLDCPGYRKRGVKRDE